MSCNALPQLLKAANAVSVFFQRDHCVCALQGTSADVMKVALIELHRQLTVLPYNCRLLVTVHDEVVMEVPKTQWPAVKEAITSIMQGVLSPQLNLNLQVNVEEGW